MPKNTSTPSEHRFLSHPAMTSDLITTARQVFGDRWYVALKDMLLLQEKATPPK